MNWYQLTRFSKRVFKIVGYLATLFLLFLIARGCLILVESFAVPFDLSNTTLIFIQALLLLLFFMIGIHLVIHFFKTKDPP